jgi:hypothetical protein
VTDTLSLHDALPISPDCALDIMMILESYKD